MIVSVVSIYDTYYLGDLFIRLAFPPFFSSLGTKCGSSYPHHDGDGGTIVTCRF